MVVLVATQKLRTHYPIITMVLVVELVILVVLVLNFQELLVQPRLFQQEVSVV